MAAKVKLSKTQKTLLATLARDPAGAIVRLGGGTWAPAWAVAEAGITDYSYQPTRAQYDFFYAHKANTNVNTLRALADRGVLEQRGDAPEWRRPYYLTALGRELAAREQAPLSGARRPARRVNRTVEAVRSCLTDDLRQRAYRGDPDPMRGHCAVASEATYFLLGGKEAGWVPHTVRVGNEVHWFLRNKSTGEVVDPTASQFACSVEYGKGRGRGFPTPGRPQPPSRRAQKVIACARRRLRR